MWVFFMVVGLAAVTMIYALVLGLRLRKIAPGGKVGSAVNTLVGFIVVFLLAYLGTPAFPWLPQEAVMATTAVVFLLGAVFVVIVLRVIDRLTRQVVDTLKGLDP